MSRGDVWGRDVEARPAAPAGASDTARAEPVSEDAQMLLDALSVPSLSELKRLVDLGKLAQSEDFVTAESVRHLTNARPDLGPGWREDSSGEVFYSAAWLDAR